MFVVEVPPGGTALIKGPAEARCKEACRVFGAGFTHFQVPPHKQYPVEGPATIQIEGGAVVLVPQSTIPPDWRLELSGVVALVGPTDSGKSSLSTYILNTHVARGKRVCVVDADVGQSDIGPPGFVAYSCTSAPTPHISELPPEGGYFVGSVNLQGVEELLVAGVVRCVREAMRQYPHLVVINTPGWTTGRGAQLLRALVEAVDATVVNIGEEVLPGQVVTRPQQITPRNPQERKELRVYAYRRHVKLIHKVVVDAGKIANCKFDKALNCPWGRYVVGDVAEPEKKGREYVVPAAYLRHVFAALYKNKRLAGYGVVEKIDQKAVLYTTTEDFDEVKLGKIRLDPHTLEELEPLP
ncbi:MAG: Clp1/GlmU family protein [Pyrobaculum sp.]